MQESRADRTPIVQFTGPLAIVGGGRVERALLRELAGRGVALVGADGGGDVIAAAGLVPEAIIGDFDSLADRAAWSGRTRLLPIAEQITTDFQKALYCTQAPVTLALGMTGGRLDHTLAALSAVQQVARTRRVLLIDEVDMALAVSGRLRFSAGQGERISIHPFCPIRFERSTGLAYPLDNLTLDPAGRLGTSNAGTGGPVEIVPHEDTPWLLVLGKDRLWDFFN